MWSVSPFVVQRRRPESPVSSKDPNISITGAPRRGMSIGVMRRALGMTAQCSVGESAAGKVFRFALRVLFRTVSAVVVRSANIGPQAAQHDGFRLSLLLTVVWRVLP